MEDMTVSMEQLRLDIRHSELLPGINDEITLNQITPKLSWRDFYILSSVSRGWRHAIQTRQVYDARVRLQSTEQLVIIDQINVVLDKKVNVIILYSMRDNSFYQAPPVPHFDDGRGCVTLDGRVYVLLCEGDVYVMDLAGQRKWTQCAIRGKSRQKVWKLKCGVIHGKIYVFHDSQEDGPEVFDPASNSWSVIKPALMKPLVRSIRTVGEELFLFCELWVPEEGKTTHILQVYDPAKDEWREGESPRIHAPFCRQGKFHSFVDGDAVYDPFIYDVITLDAEKNSWSHLCTCSFGGLQPVNSYGVRVVSVLAVDHEELLAIVTWFDYEGWVAGFDLLKSVGFGSHHSEVLWQSVDVSPSIIWPPRSTGCSISSINL